MCWPSLNNQTHSNHFKIFGTGPYSDLGLNVDLKPLHGSNVNVFGDVGNSQRSVHISVTVAFRVPICPKVHFDDYHVM